MLFRRKNRNILASINAFIWPQKGFLRGWLYLLMRVLRLRSSDYSLAAGFAAGVAVSFTPLIGLHFFMAAALAWLIRGNMIIALIGTAVGNPWTFPFIWVLIYSVGTSILGSRPIDADVSALSFTMLLEYPGTMLVSMLIGGMVVGGILFFFTLAVGYVFAGRIKDWLMDLRENRLKEFNLRRRKND